MTGTVNLLNIRTPKKFVVIIKSWTMWLYHRVMSPNDADGMANSADPDQTVWSGSALFTQTFLVRKFRKITVFKFTSLFSKSQVYNSKTAREYTNTSMHMNWYSTAIKLMPSNWSNYCCWRVFFTAYQWILKFKLIYIFFIIFDSPSPLYHTFIDV